MEAQYLESALKNAGYICEYAQKNEDWITLPSFHVVTIQKILFPANLQSGSSYSLSRHMPLRATSLVAIIYAPSVKKQCPDTDGKFDGK